MEELKESVRVQLQLLRENFLDSLYVLETKTVEYFSRVVQKFMEISEVNNTKFIAKTLKQIGEE